MGRPDLATRTRRLLLALSEALQTTLRRAVVLGGLGTLGLVLHAVTADATIAWLAAPVVVLGGLVAPRRAAMLGAASLALAHLAVDLWLGVSSSAVPGLLVRSLVLPTLALIGATGAHIEAQRDRAVHRAISEDPVTGLLNVRAFYGELAKLRATSTPFTVLLADIRGMRNLNERYGHPTGTEAMRAMAHVLRRAAGTEVLASRLGSDEIAVALIGTDRERCEAVVEQVMLRLHDELVSLPDGERFEIHAAYGIARFPEDGQDEVALLRAADRAKERAKRNGLDGVARAEAEESA